MYAEVLIEYSAKSIDKTFTYFIPSDLQKILKVGMKVIVPFGNKSIYGFVVKIKSDFDESYSIREILSIVDINFYLNSELLELGKYLQSQTLCTQIAAYQTMLPSSLKVKKQEHEYSKYLVYVVLNKTKDEVIAYCDNHPRRKGQISVLKDLMSKGRVLKNSYSNVIISALLDEELVTLEKDQIYRIVKESKDEVVRLQSAQKEAVAKINLSGYKTYLLHGVTGSGKTEVYIDLIKKVVSNGKNAILLVPEISLTTQIVNRFYARFGSDVAIFHSGLSEGEKHDEYLKIFRGEVHIVVGTRSAIFTPLKNLGIIIIDEEHSDTYKQDSNPRYHAIDMAKWRCEYYGIPLVLGSATPSLESMSRALKGVYTYVSMPNRIGSAILPDVKLIDMTEEMKLRNTIFSRLLIQKLNDRLKKREQSILLLNRRGYSTVISCKACGFTYKCPHCDITLTYHKSSNQLRCHYCGYSLFKKDFCPECKEKSLTDYGLGTEKLELELSKIFPNARIVRMDADTTRKKQAHEDIIERFRKHEYDILLGTQMIAKGLDFPLVTLVGVVNADATLAIPDFRSGERTFSLLSQVAGRAGRGTLKGEVLMQTFNPDNYILKCVVNHDYRKFYNYEMHNRHLLGYPPYFYLVTVRIASKDYDVAAKEIAKVKRYIEERVKDIFILGPTTATVFKLKNIYRFQIIIKYKKENGLFVSLSELDRIYMLNSKANLEIDNNPLQV